VDTEPTAPLPPSAPPADAAAVRAPSTEALTRLEDELAELEAELAALEASDGAGTPDRGGSPA
jgi:hypothetical protein